jgi:hypothetical protein
MLIFEFVAALLGEIDPELRKLLMSPAGTSLVFVLCQLFLRQPYTEQLLLFFNLIELLPKRCRILVPF